MTDKGKTFVDVPFDYLNIWSESLSQMNSNKLSLMKTKTRCLDLFLKLPKQFQENSKRHCNVWRLTFENNKSWTFLEEIKVKLLKSSLDHQTIPLEYLNPTRHSSWSKPINSSGNLRFKLCCRHYMFLKTFSNKTIVCHRNKKLKKELKL